MKISVKRTVLILTTLVLILTSIVNFKMSIANVNASGNFALGSTVSSSSSVENWGWYRTNLVDGIRDTDGSANGFSSALGNNSNHSEWIQLDLGSVKNISIVDLYPRNDNGNVGECFPIDFTIQLSTDGTNYTTVASISDYEKPTNIVQSFNFSPTDARYVRLEATNLRAMGDDYMMQISEMEIYSETRGDENLALGKTVYTSSSVDNWGWYPSKLVDNETGTSVQSKGWSSQLGTTSNHNEYAIIDLGEGCIINGVELYPRNDSGYLGAGFPTDFQIQVSNNSQDWTTVVSKTGYAQPTDSVESFPFSSSQKARYVRLLATGLRKVGNSYVVQLSEMKVLGEPIVEGVNLAVGKPVTCSSSVEDWGWYSDNLVDGYTDVDTANEINGWSSALGISTNHTEWASIDIGASAMINRVDLYPRNDSGYVGVGFPIDFEIQVSADNSNWITVVSETGYQQPSNEVQSFSFNGINARYVKLEATSLRQSGDSYLVQLADISVIGTYPVSTDFVIVKSDIADVVENYSATELQSYLWRITGFAPEIVTELVSGKTNIVIGQSEEALPASILNALGISITSISNGYDGYIVKNVTFNNHDVVLLSGYKTRSVLFAAYKLLEEIGCRFYGQEISSFEEIVPSNPSLAITGLDISETPHTKYRMLNNNAYYAKDYRHLDAVADWGVKNGFNSIQLGLRTFSEQYDASLLQKRGIEIHLATHNWDQFIDNSGSTWYTDELNVQTFLSNVNDYANEHPEAVAFGAWQPDGDLGAIRITGLDGQEWRFAEWNLYVTNRVAQMVRDNGINKRVMWQVYSRGNIVPKTSAGGTSYLEPDSLLDLYYFNMMQDYALPLSSGDDPVSWMLDNNRRFENTDYTTDPVPDYMLSAKQRALDWQNYCDSKNFAGARIWVDHINYNIGRWLVYPLLSYTQMGPWTNAESDLIYEKSLGYDGWTNCYEFPYRKYKIANHAPSPYWYRRISEALWNPTTNRTILDTDFYNNYYGTESTYSSDIKSYFDTVYNDIVTEPADSGTSVADVQGAYYTTITNIYNSMIVDPNVTQAQKDRITEVYLWHTDIYIPRKVKYYNDGNLF